jgi:hypothetical protein
LLVSERPRTVPSRFDGWPEQSLTKDEMLDDITLYWLTNSAISSAQLYWENNATDEGLP